jgi:ABC-type spermidine/putrescine transport system permease subunit I
MTLIAAGSPRFAAAAMRGGGKRRDAVTSTLLLLPALLFLAIWFVLPLAILFRLSLGATGGPISGYAELLGSDVYRQVFGKTVVLAFNVAAISIAFAYPAAYLMTRLKGWVLSLAVACLLFPLWISVLVRTFSWILLLETNGPINATLVALGLVERPLSLLFNNAGVYIGMVHVLLPYALLPIYTAMRGVDERLLRASEGLGASPWASFLRVYLPLTMPGILAGFAFVFLLGLGFFITPALLGGMQNVTVPMLIDNFVSERLVWPLAAAASFCLLFLILLLLAATGRFLNLGQIVAAR